MLQSALGVTVPEAESWVKDLCDGTVAILPMLLSATRLTPCANLLATKHQFFVHPLN